MYETGISLCPYGLCEHHASLLPFSLFSFQIFLNGFSNIFWLQIMLTWAQPAESTTEYAVSALLTQVSAVILSWLQPGILHRDLTWAIYFGLQVIPISSRVCPAIIRQFILFSFIICLRVGMGLAVSLGKTNLCCLRKSIN